MSIYDNYLTGEYKKLKELKLKLTVLQEMKDREHKHSKKLIINSFLIDTNDCINYVKGTIVQLENSKKVEEVEKLCLDIIKKYKENEKIKEIL